MSSISNGTDRARPERISSTPDEPRSRASAGALGLLVAALAVVSAVAAHVIDVVTVEGGADVGAAVGSAAVVSVALFASAPVLALLAAVLRKHALAGAVLAGAGLVSVGAVVLDLVLLTNPIDANRLELYRPLSAAALSPSAGAYLVLTSHVLIVAAGLAGWATVQRESMRDGYGFSESSELYGRATAIRVGGGLSSLLGVAAVLVLAGQFAPPFTSTDPVFLVPPVIDSVRAVAIGSGLLGLAVVIAVASALSSASPVVAAGTLIGAGSVVLSVSAPRVVSAMASGDRVGIGAGSVLAALAGIVLIVLGASIPAIATARDRRARSSIERQAPSRDTTAASNRRERAAEIAASVRSTSNKWHTAAGISGMATGLVVAVGSFLPILTLPDGIAVPTILATRVVLVAGVLMVAVSVPLLLSEFNATTRPVLAVMWVVVFMASTGVLQAVVLAKDVTGVGIGVGAVLIGVGVALSIATGVLVWFAGSAERDDIDTSESFGARKTVLAVAVVGGVLAAIGLALPLYRGTNFDAAAVGAFPWGWDTWGQVVLAVTVVGVAVVAPRSRPARGAALLVGSVLALAVYLLGWPLTEGRVADASMGPGVVPAAAGLVILGVAAVLSGRRTGE